MEFGKWMQEERTKRKWNRQHVGDKIGVHENTIARWEHGDNIPLAMAEQIAGIYNAEIKLICH